MPKGVPDFVLPPRKPDGWCEVTVKTPNSEFSLAGIDMEASVLSTDDIGNAVQKCVCGYFGRKGRVVLVIDLDDNYEPKTEVL